jgi:hypothetical protein
MARTKQTARRSDGRKFAGKTTKALRNSTTPKVGGIKKPRR